MKGLLCSHGPCAYTPLQEVLYRLPSEPQQEQEHSSSHTAQLGLQRGGWEAASEAMEVDSGNTMSEGSGKESESEAGVPGSMSTSNSDGDEKDSKSSGEQGSTANSGSKGDEEDSRSSSSSSSSSSSKEDDKWSVETQASSDQEAPFDDDALHSGETGGTENMAALQSLLIRAGTRQSEANYETLILASTLSSVLLGQGASSPPMQQLLVADGRLVIAGAVHHSSWAADGVGSSSSSSSSSSNGHESKSNGGSCSNSSNDKTISGCAALAGTEIGMPSAERQNVAPHTPVAVLLVRPEDFCQTLPTDTESSGVNGSRSQLQQQELQPTPMGDLVLRRWLLRAAGVRVVEVAEAEWAAVMKHEAAASLLISEALQQQQQK
ncbi:hypothetical protein DUNSADRAFT_5525 [Dunaliella salina]|uniref:Encoded protein n=1 Tax=Dunaliella salina TaxID=3046 RepID=A0ABQ7GQ66_DUNSA|nr:hypothetical protein DUNSADRAFT_5525 [Dunaliella salina]|eukprot:KAF5836736.1 hypothetical protein DUNSADRAFT_5525 [Dunaliella salina]